MSATIQVKRQFTITVPELLDQVSYVFFNPETLKVRTINGRKKSDDIGDHGPPLSLIDRLGRTGFIFSNWHFSKKTS